MPIFTNNLTLIVVQNCSKTLKWRLIDRKISKFPFMFYGYEVNLSHYDTISIDSGLSWKDSVPGFPNGYIGRISKGYYRCMTRDTSSDTHISSYTCYVDHINSLEDIQDAFDPNELSFSDDIDKVYNEEFIKNCVHRIRQSLHIRMLLEKAWKDKNNNFNKLPIELVSIIFTLAIFD